MQVFNLDNTCCLYTDAHLTVYRCTPHWNELGQLSVNHSFIIITHCFSSTCAISSSAVANESRSLWTIKKQVTKQEWKNCQETALVPVLLPGLGSQHLRSTGFRQLLAWTSNMANCNGATPLCYLSGMALIWCLSTPPQAWCRVIPGTAASERD